MHSFFLFVLSLRHQHLAHLANNRNITGFRSNGIVTAPVPSYCFRSFTLMDGKVHDAQDGEKEAQNERTLDVQMKSMIL